MQIKNILKKEQKYLNWKTYSSLISQIEYWFFINNTTKESLKNGGG